MELVGEAVVATLVVSSDFQGDETTDDPGVVAYFQIEGSLHCLPCDRWFTVAQNAQGIALTLKAMLDIGKHSNPEIAARMLRVLAAAVEPPMRTWRDVLGFPPSLPITPALLLALGVAERGETVAVIDSDASSLQMTPLAEAVRKVPWPSRPRPSSAR